MTIDTAKPFILPDAQTVTEVEHYTDNLFRFCVTRPASMRFRSGEFVMIGLMGDPHPGTGRQKPLLRAYSIASRAWDETSLFIAIQHFRRVQGKLYSQSLPPQPSLLF